MHRILPMDCHELRRMNKEIMDRLPAHPGRFVAWGARW